jgi:type VI secretion system secreted protein Hcp
MKPRFVQTLAAAAILVSIASVPTAHAQKNKKGNEVMQLQSATPMLSTGPVTFYVTIRAARQGVLKGQTTNAAHKDQIQGLQFVAQLSAPKDAATGQASGKRQYLPISITKQWDASSPQIYDAASSNELLTLVEFDFVRTASNGQEYTFETIKLTDATISSVKDYILTPPSAGPTGAANPQALEDVAFTFQKIEITNNDGKTTAIDNWAQ